MVFLQSSPLTVVPNFLSDDGGRLFCCELSTNAVFEGGGTSMQCVSVSTVRSALPCLIFVLLHFLKNNDLRVGVLLQLVTFSVVVFSFGLFHFDYVTSVLKVTLIVFTGRSVNNACK